MSEYERFHVEYYQVKPTVTSGGGMLTLPPFRLPPFRLPCLHCNGSGLQPSSFAATDGIVQRVCMVQIPGLPIQLCDYRDETAGRQCVRCGQLEWP